MPERLLQQVVRCFSPRVISVVDLNHWYFSSVDQSQSERSLRSNNTDAVRRHTRTAHTDTRTHAHIPLFGVSLSDCLHSSARRRGVRRSPMHCASTARFVVSTWSATTSAASVPGHLQTCCWYVSLRGTVWVVHFAALYVSVCLSVCR